MMGVPANANTNQRFLTVEAFRSAGCDVIGLLNEPSAASIEFGHKTKIRGVILVYDLGGDDFDEILAELATSSDERHGLSQGEHFRLLEECRARKEALNPNSRRIVIDLDTVREGWGTAS